ncbi:MAG: GLPGLI family protein [Bacteroidales bacterium]|nr:GLPGLI family protein [Bacteroidales bacterium]
MKYNRRFFALAFFLFHFTSLVVCAQEEDPNAWRKRLNYFYPETVLDSSNVECIYDYYVTDTVRNERKRTEFILLHGKQYSKYMDYEAYRLDSVECTRDRTKLTWGDCDDIRKEYNIITTTSSLIYLLKDHASGMIQVFDKVFMDKYTYLDSLARFEWELVDSTREVCGYVCHKATTSFRGRKWTAWYCDLPINDGPWKFSGLPGLILAIYDTSTCQRFIANTIRMGKSCIKRIERDDIKTTREKFNKALKQYKEDPRGLRHAMGIEVKVVNNGGETGTPYRRGFYNPLELE